MQTIYTFRDCESHDLCICHLTFLKSEPSRPFPQWKKELERNALATAWIQPCDKTLFQVREKPKKSKCNLKTASNLTNPAVTCELAFLTFSWGYPSCDALKLSNSKFLSWIWKPGHRQLPMSSTAPPRIIPNPPDIVCPAFRSYQQKNCPTTRTHEVLCVVPWKPQVIVQCNLSVLGHVSCAYARYAKFALKMGSATACCVKHDLWYW
jgi:hypothetical protein